MLRSRFPQLHRLLLLFPLKCREHFWNSGYATVVQDAVLLSCASPQESSAILCYISASPIDLLAENCQKQQEKCSLIFIVYCDTANTINATSVLILSSFCQVLSCLATLLRRQNLVAWNYPVTMQVFHGLLSFTVHVKPKVSHWRCQLSHVVRHNSAHSGKFHCKQTVRFSVAVTQNGLDPPEPSQGWKNWNETFPLQVQISLPEGGGTWSCIKRGKGKKLCCQGGHFSTYGEFPVDPSLSVYGW